MKTFKVTLLQDKVPTYVTVEATNMIEAMQKVEKSSGGIARDAKPVKATQKSSLPATQDDVKPVKDTQKPLEVTYDVVIAGVGTVKIDAVDEYDAMDKAEALYPESSAIGANVATKTTRKTWQQRWEDLTENYDYVINDRDGFVCDYVSLLTQKASQRERLSDSAYQLKKVGKKYQLFYMKQPMFKPSDADTTYSWFCRLPLQKFAQEANNYRCQIYTQLNG